MPDLVTNSSQGLIQAENNIVTLPYELATNIRLVAVLTFKQKLVLRAPVAINSSVVSVNVIKVTQPPQDLQLRVVLTLDVRQNLNLLNVRAQTNLIVQLGFPVGKFPSCQLLKPSTLVEQIQISILPPISPTSLAVSCLGAVGAVTAASMGNPSTAVHQAVFLSFADIAACAFSDVESLDFSSGMFGMTIGSELGQHYRGTVISFLICMGSFVLVFFVGIRMYSDYNRCLADQWRHAHTSLLAVMGSIRNASCARCNVAVLPPEDSLISSILLD